MNRGAKVGGAVVFVLTDLAFLHATLAADHLAWRLTYGTFVALYAVFAWCMRDARQAPRG